MEPMAPDWRSIGAAPTPANGRAEPANGRAEPANGRAEPANGRAEPANGRAEPAGVLPSARQVMLVVGALLATLVSGAIVALLLMPTTGGVTIDAQDAGVMLATGDGTRDGAAVVEDLGRVVGEDPTQLVVDVEGAVARPGLVHVPVGGRVGDALSLAGGFAQNADLATAAETLNLAQVVSDGLKIVVPAIGDARPASTPDAPTAADAPGSGPVDLNHATEAALDALPGVGPATIAEIVAAREEAPFRTVDELRSRGIVGEATLAKLRDLVTVGR